MRAVLPARAAKRLLRFQTVHSKSLIWILREGSTYRIPYIYIYAIKMYDPRVVHLYCCTNLDEHTTTGNIILLLMVPVCMSRRASSRKRDWVWEWCVRVCAYNTWLWGLWFNRYCWGSADTRCIVSPHSSKSSIIMTPTADDANDAPESLDMMDGAGLVACHYRISRSIYLFNHKNTACRKYPF